MRFALSKPFAETTTIRIEMELPGMKSPFKYSTGSVMGAYHGKHSFDAFTHYKPFVKRGTWIDPSIRYAPYPTSFNWLKKLLKNI